MKIINNPYQLKQKKVNYLNVLRQKSILYFCFFVVTFFISCNSSSTSSDNGGEERKTISENDFTISTTSVTKELNYTDTNYGKVELNSEVTADFAILNSNVGDDAVSINADGVISVMNGVSVGDYTFQVQVTGTGEYSGSVITDNLKLYVTDNPISENDFTISRSSATKIFDYTDISYGNITLNGGVTANFAIAASTVPNNNAVNIDNNGTITVATGIIAGTYTFQIEVIGTGDYGGSVIVNLTLIISPKPITEDDFTISTTRFTKTVGYNNSSYGSITSSGGITADFEISSTTPQNDKINIDGNGVITVATGLELGIYTFAVKITGTGNYGGDVTIDDLKLYVAQNPITQNNFTLSETSVTKELDYGNMSYGKVTLNSGVIATFEILNSTVPNDGAKINPGGDISVSTGLGLGTYTFQLEIIATGNYDGSVIINLTLNVVYPPLYNVFNLDNGQTPARLSNPNKAHVAKIGDKTYLFVTSSLIQGSSDDAVNVFNITNNGTLVLTDSATDNNFINIKGAWGLTTIVIDTVTYLIVTGQNDLGASVFQVSDDGGLRYIRNITNDDNPESSSALNGATGITSFELNNTPYIFIAGVGPIAGLTGFKVGTIENLEFVYNYNQDATIGLLLNRPFGITSTMVNNTFYVFVGSTLGNKIDAFKVENDGALTFLQNSTIIDNNQRNLSSVQNLTSAVVNGTTYLFASGFSDNGISSFRLTEANNGTLNINNAANVSDSDSLELNGASGLTTAVVNGKTYLFVAGTGDNGVSMFEINNQGNLTNVDNVGDGGSLELNGASDVAVAKIGEVTYLVVTGNNDNGISVFRVTSR